MVALLRRKIGRRDRAAALLRGELRHAAPYAGASPPRRMAPPPVAVHKQWHEDGYADELAAVEADWGRDGGDGYGHDGGGDGYDWGEGAWQDGRGGEQRNDGGWQGGHHPYGPADGGWGAAPPGDAAAGWSHGYPPADGGWYTDEAPPDAEQQGWHQGPSPVRPERL